MKKTISILGSTGSIGKSTLNIIRNFPARFNVYGLACSQNVDLIYHQIKEFNPKKVCVTDERKASELKSRLKGKRPEVYAGARGLLKIVTGSEIDLVVAAMSGTESLNVFFEAIRHGKDIAFANKEVIVGFGNFIMKEAKKKGVNIIPLDSELSAIFQCLQGNDIKKLDSIILTASGGPFYNLGKDKLQKVTSLQALRHPVWKMGKKISVDSATLMNKGLEVIETSNFFGVSADKIKVLIHPQAAVHSMVNFIDGSSLAQMAIPDMRIPIQYALFFPERVKSRLPSINLAKIVNLEFIEPDFRKLPCLKYAIDAARKGGCMPAVLNASDEVAVKAFIDGKIGFMDIPKIVKRTINGFGKKFGDNRKVKLRQLLAADIWGRVEAERITADMGRV